MLLPDYGEDHSEAARSMVSAMYHSPGDDAFGVDANHRLRLLDGLRPSTDLDPPGLEGVGGDDVVHHEGGATSSRGVAELLRVREVSPADVYGVEIGVVGEHAYGRYVRGVASKPTLARRPRRPLLRYSILPCVKILIPPSACIPRPPFEEVAVGILEAVRVCTHPLETDGTVHFYALTLDMLDGIRELVSGDLKGQMHLPPPLTFRPRVMLFKE